MTEVVILVGDACAPGRYATNVLDDFGGKLKDGAISDPPIHTAAELTNYQLIPLTTHHPTYQPEHRISKGKTLATTIRSERGKDHPCQPSAIPRVPPIALQEDETRQQAVQLVIPRSSITTFRPLCDLQPVSDTGTEMCLPRCRGIFEAKLFGLRPWPK